MSREKYTIPHYILGWGTQADLKARFFVNFIEYVDMKMYKGETMPFDPHTRGQLFIGNTSKENTLTDIFIHLSNKRKDSNLDDVINISSLQSQAKWEKEYDIKPLTEIKPLIKFDEEFTPAKGKDDLYLLRMEIQNLANEDMNNILISKILGEETRIMYSNLKKNKIRKENSAMVFELEKLEPKTSIQVELELRTKNIKDIEEETFLQYYFTRCLYSNLDTITAHAKSEHEYEFEPSRKEKYDWSCTFTFYNKSDFPMHLHNYQILYHEKNQTKEVISEIEEIIMPHQEHAEIPIKITSPDKPIIGEINFDVVSEEDKYTFVKIEMKNK